MCTTKYLHERGILPLDFANAWLCGWRTKGLFVGARRDRFALSLLVAIWPCQSLALGAGHCAAGRGRRPDGVEGCGSLGIGSSRRELARGWITDRGGGWVQADTAEV